MMNIDPKTGKVTYDNPEAVDAFADELVKAMVDNLNKSVKDEDDGQRKTTTP